MKNIYRQLRETVVAAGSLMVAAVLLLAPVLAANPLPELFGRAAGAAVSLTSQYPAGAAPINAFGSGTTGVVVDTLPAVAGRTTFICGYTVDADATAATVATTSIAGLISGSLFRRESVGAVASATATTTQNFNPCIPASAQNTAITVQSSAVGVGGNVYITAWGFQL